MTDDLTLPAIETFGSPAAQAMQRRAWALWQEVKDDPAYSTHGRSVGIAAPHLLPLSRQVELARIQGAGACENVAEADLPARLAALEAEGLVTDTYVDWRSGPATAAKVGERLAGRPFPEDLTLGFVDASTPPEVMAGLDAVTSACEVLLPMGPFIRGEARPAACAYVAEPTGRIVGAAASVMMFHPASVCPSLCWWGMLSTHPDRRGQGIASRLGAVVLQRMREAHGLTDFLTGIRTGNGPSEALCDKLGFGPTPFHVVIAIDPQVMGGNRVTK